VLTSVLVIVLKDGGVVKAIDDSLPTDVNGVIADDAVLGGAACSSVDATTSADVSSTDLGVVDEGVLNTVDGAILFEIDGADKDDLNGADVDDISLSVSGSPVRKLTTCS